MDEELLNISTTEVKKKKLKKKSVKEKVPRSINYYEIDITDIPSAVYAFNKFMTTHSEFFKTNVNKKMVYINDNIYYIYKDAVYFKDTIHKVSGYISTEFVDNKYKMVVSVRLLSKTAKSASAGEKDEVIDYNDKHSCYIKQVEAYMSNILKNGDYIELFYHKILNDTIIKYCFYSQPTLAWENDMTILQNEFFSSEKNYLLSIINNKKNDNKIGNNRIGNITSSWNNLILHGPPGSGKSSFIYRMAMALKMSILSIDISLYLNKKRELYALFHNQEFALPNDITNKQPALNNVIIVLEEFDNAIEKLVDIENIFKYKNVLTRNYLDLKNKEIKEKAKCISTLDEDDVLNHKMEDAIKPKKETDNKTLTYEEQVERDLMSDGFDIANNKVMDKARMNVLSMRSHDNEINAINAELNNIIRSMDADNTSNILRLSDLLELFQSPVHIKNRLIIATTNHFDKIKNVLPQLFRSGRLSGIELSYLDWDSLNELTQYYFKQPMNREEFKITIPTSEVIELAIKYTLSKKPFEQFKQELFYKCSLI